MSQTALPRDSIEYLEILSDVFAALIRKASTAQESNENGEITHSLAQCLESIYLHGPSSIRKIAAGLGVSFPAASQLVDRLYQKALVTREHSKEDRRLALVELTDEGRAVVKRIRESRTVWLRDILGRMPEELRSSLVDSMEEFIRLALETGGQTDEACARCGIDHLAFCVVSRSHKQMTGEHFEEILICTG